MKLICFPHAGGMSGYYAFLKRAPLAGIDSVDLVEYPGRGSRAAQEGYRDFQDCVERVSARLADEGLEDGCYVLFGHSMGAFVAYEVACLLQERYGLRPLHVFVSGQKPPCRVVPEHYAQCESDGIDFLKRLGGVPELILEDEGIARYFIGLCAKDLRILQTYSPRPPDPANRPLVGSVICGDDDLEVSLDELEDWWGYFAVPPQVKVMHGNHFYLREREEELVAFMNERLRASAAAGLRRGA